MFSKAAGSAIFDAMILPRLFLVSMVFSGAILVADKSHAVGPLPKNAAWIHRVGTETLPGLFQKELAAAAQKKQPVVLIFTADWCTPCKALRKLLADSAPVRKASATGRFLFIDVDEWRGPAQALIPGVDAAQLPTVARVDAKGALLVKCFGTDLGLLSPTATAKNITRLLAGEAPNRPDYEASPDTMRNLAVEDNQADAAEAKSHAELVVVVQKKTPLPNGRVAYALQVTIWNHDGPRKWFAIPKALDVPLSATPKPTAFRDLKFAEHVRAGMAVFEGAPAFWAVPVAGYGSVQLGNLVVEGPAKGGTLEIWALGSLTVGSRPLEFQKKLPYSLVIQDASKTSILSGVGSPIVGVTGQRKIGAAVK